MLDPTQYDDKLKTFWTWECPGIGTQCIALRVDETSSKKELQAEYDYFEDQLVTWSNEIPMVEKREWWALLATLQEWIDNAR